MFDKVQLNRNRFSLAFFLTKQDNQKVKKKKKIRKTTHTIITKISVMGMNIKRSNLKTD